MSMFVLTVLLILGINSSSQPFFFFFFAILSRHIETILAISDSAEVPGEGPLVLAFYSGKQRGEFPCWNFTCALPVLPLSELAHKKPASTSRCQAADGSRYKCLSSGNVSPLPIMSVALLSSALP